ncbi:MAG: 2-hydroxyacyl-CoA dehydratase subunit D [Actinomycetota bacterium]
MRADTAAAVEKQFQKSLESSRDNLFGWMCTYTPVELIYAAGFIPHRIYGIQDFRSADSYLPINFCPYLKSSLEQLLKEGDRFRGMVFANSCDGSRRLFDMAREYLPRLASHIIDVPRIISPASLDFYRLNIEKFFHFLQDLSGTEIATEKVLDSIKQFNHLKGALQSLRHAYLEGLVSLEDYYRIVKISANSDPAVFCTEIDSLIGRFSQTEKKEQVGPRLMIVGNFINEERLFKIISELDCLLIHDDLCTTQRYFNNEVECGDDNIFHRLAESYLSKTACMRMADMGAKLKDMQQIIGRKKIEAVIFVSLKFCDNTLYFYPLVKKNLDIPVLNLELEYNNFSEGQVKTRLEAFLEML